MVADAKFVGAALKHVAVGLAIADGSRELAAAADRLAALSAKEGGK